MDHRASIRRVSRLLGLGGLIGVGLFLGCGLFPYRSLEIEGIRCEVPRDWEPLSGGGSPILVRSPDSVRGVGAFFSVHSERLLGREELTRSMEYKRRVYARDRNFTMDELRQIRVAGVDGFLISSTRTEYGPFHHPPPGVALGPVKFREAEVHFVAGGKAYEMIFGAPIELVDKYRPAFHHFLATLKVPQ